MGNDIYLMCTIFANLYVLSTWGPTWFTSECIEYRKVDSVLRSVEEEELG